MKRNFDATIAGRDFDLALREVTRAMYALQMVLERFDGDEDIICDGYPFIASYDEQVASVGAWCELVAEKAGE